MIRSGEKEIGVLSFVALLGIVFMLVFSGLQLTKVPSMIGQAVKFAITKASPSTMCSETDNGNQDAIKGTTVLKQNAHVKNSKTDICIDTSNLKEYYCESNQIKGATYECVCADGECISYIYEKEEEKIKITSATEVLATKESESYQQKKTSSLTSVTQSNPLAVAGCIDSDGGKIYGEYGTANDEDTKEIDKCRTDGKLTEYYCDSNGVVQSEVVSCASGEICSLGQCVTKGTCTDSETTFNMYAVGRVAGIWYGTETSGEWVDVCDSSTGKVFEYYCRDEGYAYYYLKECPAGYTCAEGLCADLCVDTDEKGNNFGEDYTIQGTATGTWYTTGEEGSWTDSCSGSGQIVENYCYKGYVYKTEKTCPSETICSNGACV